MTASLHARVGVASLLLCAVCGLGACDKDPASLSASSGEDYALRIPVGFPEPDIPPDNVLTRSRVDLGRRLFFDPLLSADSTRSCASCHDPRRAFSDSTSISLGIEQRPGVRNTPSLGNVAYQHRLLREGSVPTLEMQVLVPIQEHNEFDFNILRIADRLRQMPDYIDLSTRAYARPPDAFVITRALAAYQRTLLSGDSPFDQWLFQGKNAVLGESAQRGYALFQSQRLGCTGCHNGFLLTNQAYENNGLYLVYPDSGRMRLTGLEADRGRFKVPSLRNVAVTAPYMHDGSLPTLDAVLTHYQSGGQPHPNRSALLRAFPLTPEERADLLAFLRSLTDETFLREHGEQ